jgi:hypothetical protein
MKTHIHVHLPVNPMNPCLRPEQDFVAEIVPTLGKHDLVLFLTVEGDAFSDLGPVSAGVAASPAAVAHMSVGLEGSPADARPSVPRYGPGTSGASCGVGVSRIAAIACCSFVALERPNHNMCAAIPMYHAC